MAARVFAWPRPPDHMLWADTARQVRLLRRCEGWAFALQALGWAVGLVAMRQVPPAQCPRLFSGALAVGAQAVLTWAGASLLAHLTLRPAMGPVGPHEVLRLSRWLLAFAALLTLGTWVWAATAALASWAAAHG